MKRPFNRRAAATTFGIVSILPALLLIRVLFGEDAVKILLATSFLLGLSSILIYLLYSFLDEVVFSS